MTDTLDEQNTALVHDLQKTALNNACYIAWIGSGAGMGAFVGSGAAGVGAGPGALIGGLAGLIWAVKTCKPITSAAGQRMTTSFLSDKELSDFQHRLNQYAPVSRDQALALAKIALDSYPQPHHASPSIAFKGELERLLNS